jgi:hypothetical protein
MDNVEIIRWGIFDNTEDIRLRTGIETDRVILGVDQGNRLWLALVYIDDIVILPIGLDPGYFD